MPLKTPKTKSSALATTIALLIGGGLIAATAISAETPPSDLKVARTAQAGTHAGESIAGRLTARPPRIQLAILLDTSNSMDGLIDQTRNQLWQVVNEFSTTQRNGVTPILEIALFEYGNSRNSRQSGYVRMLNGFTRELDAVSQGLFSLTTSGGNEYCGYAIKSAIEQLQWSQSDSDIKSIFIAGNEPFTQGPVNFRRAIALAKQRGVSINTIHAGDHDTGILGGWEAGARLAGGDYMSIDADQQIAHIVAPQDARIADLNARLNQTYLPFGKRGEEKLERQASQDRANAEIAPGLLSKRAISKSSSFYNNAGWDLVDGLAATDTPAQWLESIVEDELPAPMLDMTSAERLQYIQKKAAERAEIKRDIDDLSRQRSDYIKEKQVEQAATKPSMSDALTRSVRKQAQQKNFSLDK